MPKAWIINIIKNSKFYISLVINNQVSQFKAETDEEKLKWENLLQAKYKEFQDIYYQHNKHGLDFTL